MVDYRVWVNAEARPVEEWAARIQSTIDEAVQDGLVLLLLSEASSQSQFLRQLVLHALKRAAASVWSNVVPVSASPFEHSVLLRERQSIQYLDLTNGPFEERVEALIRSLRIREME